MTRTPVFARADGRAVAARQASRRPHPHLASEHLAVFCRIRDEHPGFSVDACQQRLLEGMRVRPAGVTPFEARLHLGIYHPAAIVNKLRRQGRLIHSEPVWRVDEEGNPRGTVAYTLDDHG
ncbi:helix-turn-helix domain-containing protein [Roseateles sp. P5_E4]